MKSRIGALVGTLNDLEGVAELLVDIGPDVLKLFRNVADIRFFETRYLLCSSWTLVGLGRSVGYQLRNVVCIVLCLEPALIIS